MSYDLVTVGGGIAGSSLALVMARHGASVLLLEREEHFRDRIRGEAIHVWGTVEARAIGIHDLLLERCAHEFGFINVYEDGLQVSSRNLVETTPARGMDLTFYHPDMQETLIEAAQAAGAEVWKGARVDAIVPGDPPHVAVRHDSVEHDVAARLVVGADGRRSAARKWGRFDVRRDPENLRITGVLISGVPADEAALQIFTGPDAAWNTQFIPLGRQRFRAYFGSGDRKRHPPIGGKQGAVSFLNYARDSGVPDAWLDAIQLDGPLASFECASWWVDHPYRQGVALIGDAAAAPDPNFGNGLSIALRDVRVLSHHLLANPDWDMAAQHYASDHDAYFQTLHRLEGWYAVALFSVGDETKLIREHAREAFKRGEAPNNIGCGPDQTADDAVRKQFLGY